MGKNNENNESGNITAGLLGASLLALATSAYAIWRLKKDSEKQIKKFVRDYDEISDRLTRTKMSRDELRDTVRDLRLSFENERHLTMDELTNRISNLVIQMEVQNDALEKRRKVKGKIQEFVSKISTK